MKKIFVTRRIPELGISMLKEKGYEVVVSDWTVPPTKEQIIEALKKDQYDAVLTLLTDKVDAELLDAAKAQGARIISNYAIGFDNIDVKAAYDRGLFVSNTPGQFSDCVAEHTVALLLALTTRLAEGDRFVRAGKYTGWDPMILIGTDLHGKVLGLIGAGQIGGLAANRLIKGFGMSCVYYDVKRNEKLEQETGARFIETVEGVLKEADVVSLHVPLLPSTRHLMNAERFKLMKPTAYLINTARGAVVDEAALVDALKNNVIAGAGIDVYENEPVLAAGLTELENVILTPHIASARQSARDEMARLAAQNIIDVLEGGEPTCKVTSEMVH